MLREQAEELTRIVIWYSIHGMGNVYIETCIDRIASTNWSLFQ